VDAPNEGIVALNAPIEGLVALNAPIEGIGAFARRHLTGAFKENKKGEIAEYKPFYLIYAGDGRGEVVV
jgi:hypothetical protein